MDLRADLYYLPLRENLSLATTTQTGGSMKTHLAIPKLWLMGTRTALWTLIVRNAKLAIGPCCPKRPLPDPHPLAAHAKGKMMPKKFKVFQTDGEAGLSTALNNPPDGYCMHSWSATHVPNEIYRDMVYTIVYMRLTT